MSTRDWLRRLIAHWDEFGPAYGFSELIDLARDHVRAEERREAQRETAEADARAR